MIVPYPYQSLKLVSEDERHWRFFCPFHKETEGSFTVNKSESFRLFYRCWACGENGSAKQFAVKFLGHDPKIFNKQLEAVIPYDVEYMEHIKPKINWDSFRGTPLEHLPAEEQRLAEAVGVSVETIRKFGIGWRDYRFLIPMYDEEGICGIAVRWYEVPEEDTTGMAMYGICKKRCIKGSKHGWFMPAKSTYTQELPTFITEGWSDTAVLMECGFQAIGRFNAGDIRFTPDWDRATTYIVTDNDETGITGSQKLQKLIGGTIISPPTVATPAGWRTCGHTIKHYKDIREFFLSVGKDACRRWLESQL